MDIKSLNTEELVEVASSSSPLKRDNRSISVDKFIRRMNISRGQTRVPNYLIYYIYMQYNTESNKATKIAFFRHFGKEFQAVRWGKQRFYLLEWPVEITKELIEKAKNHARRYQGKKESEIKEFK